MTTIPFHVRLVRVILIVFFNGNFFHLASSFVYARPIAPKAFSASPTTLKSSVDTQLWFELAAAITFGTVVDPVVETIFINIYRRDREDILANKKQGVIKYNNDKEADEAFESTLLYSAVDSISIAGRIAAVFIGIDIIQTITDKSFVPPILVGEEGNVLPLSQAGFSVASVVWVAITLSTIKRAIFLQYASGNKLGRVVLYDRLIDFLLLSAAIAVSLDALNVDLGMGAMSLLAGSGVSALLFSLASKDLAEAIVGGFIVQAWDAFTEGDEIRLQDGTEGTVTRIGLVDIDLLQSDNTVVKIPNSQLTKIRIINLSRVEISQVEQKLRFQYSDLEKLSTVVLQEIKNEIKAACPQLVTDGSKPFSVVLTSFEPDHLAVKVNCHFTIPPTSSDASTNRQKVIEAINTAVTKHNVTFALPTINYYETVQRSVEK